MSIYACMLAYVCHIFEARAAVAEILALLHLCLDRLKGHFLYFGRYKICYGFIDLHLFI